MDAPPLTCRCRRTGCRGRRSSLTMLNCGTYRLVYNCSIDCQKAARSKHKVCVPKRNMDDVLGLSVGSFAEDEA
jgi:hypothetical protein